VRGVCEKLPSTRVHQGGGLVVGVVRVGEWDKASTRGGRGREHANAGGHRGQRFRRDLFSAGLVCQLMPSKSSSTSRRRRAPAQGRSRSSGNASSGSPKKSSVRRTRTVGRQPAQEVQVTAHAPRAARDSR
jgi:hypothetical protein